jgi:hypothetical protein
MALNDRVLLRVDSLALVETRAGRERCTCARYLSAVISALVNAVVSGGENVVASADEYAANASARARGASCHKLRHKEEILIDVKP